MKKLKIFNESYQYNTISELEKNQELNQRDIGAFKNNNKIKLYSYRLKLLMINIIYIIYNWKFHIWRNFYWVSYI